MNYFSIFTFFISICQESAIPTCFLPEYFLLVLNYYVFLHT